MTLSPPPTHTKIGAFERYLASIPQESGSIPRTMKAIVPFSFELGKSKESSDSEANDDDDDVLIGEGSMKNSVSSLFIDIPIACKDDKSRLQTCAKELQAHKIGPHVFISSFGIWLISHCLPKSWAAYLFTHYARKCTVILSSVPGPTEPLLFADTNLISAYGMPPAVGDIGICIATLSYNNKMYLAAFVDDKIPERDVLAESFNQAFQSLYDQTVLKKPPASKRKGRKGRTDLIFDVIRRSKLDVDFSLSKNVPLKSKNQYRGAASLWLSKRSDDGIGGNLAMLGFSVTENSRPPIHSVPLDCNTWIQTDESSLTIRVFAHAMKKGGPMVLCLKCSSWEDFQNWSADMEKVVQEMRCAAGDASNTIIRERMLCASTQSRSPHHASKHVALKRPPNKSVEEAKQTYARFVLESYDTAAAPDLSFHGVQDVALTMTCVLSCFKARGVNKNRPGTDERFRRLQKACQHAVSCASTEVQSRAPDSELLMSLLLRIYLLQLSCPLEGPLLTKQDLSNIEAAFRCWAYWGDDQWATSDVVFWKETHTALCASSEWLVGRLLPFETFTSGLTGADHARRAFPRLKRWLLARIEYGFGNCNNRFHYCPALAALLNLVDFSCHPALSQKDEQSEWVEAVSVKITDLLMQDCVRGCRPASFNGASLRAHNDFAQLVRANDLNQLARIVSSKTLNEHPNFDTLRHDVSLSAGLFCSSEYQFPHNLSALIRAKETKAFEWKWRSGMPLQELKKVSFEDTWLILGAGGDQTALLYPQNKKYINAFGLVSKKGGASHALPGQRLVRSRMNWGDLQKDDREFQGSLLVDIHFQTVSTPGVSMSVCSRLLSAGCHLESDPIPCVAWIDEHAYVQPVASSVPQIACRDGISLLLYNPNYSVKKNKNFGIGMRFQPESFDAVIDVKDAGAKVWQVARKCIEQSNETKCEGFIAFCSSKQLSRKVHDGREEAHGEWTTNERYGDPHAFILRIGWASTFGAEEANIFNFSSFEAFCSSISQSIASFPPSSSTTPPQCTLSYDNHNFVLEWGKAAKYDGSDAGDSDFPYMKPENVGQAY
jgi:hypothetical protein